MLVLYRKSLTGIIGDDPVETNPPRGGGGGGAGAGAGGGIRSAATGAGSIALEVFNSWFVGWVPHPTNNETRINEKSCFMI